MLNNFVKKYKVFSINVIEIDAFGRSNLKKSLKKQEFIIL